MLQPANLSLTANKDEEKNKSGEVFVKQCIILNKCRNAELETNIPHTHKL